ncbi:DNA cytosine methyltransferase [Martelella sp. FLE1502]
MTAYYNEIDPYAAQWLRNLIDENLIAPGDVDERSIVDVKADDLKGYAQCHFFAGIGGWSLALRKAGWEDERPVWTGSCPCQPFSAAGKQEGFEDPRHLWPQLKRLIEKRLPSVFFGEQVASATEWLAIVRRDLEEVGYAMGAIPVEAASAGADHLRDRFWIVADYDIECPCKEREQRSGEFCGSSCVAEDHVFVLSDLQGERGNRGEDTPEPSRWNGLEVVRFGSRKYLEFPDGKWRHVPSSGVRWMGTGIPARVGKLRAFGNAIDWRPASEIIKAHMSIKDAA